MAKTIEITGNDSIDTEVPITPQLWKDLPNDPALSASIYDMVRATAQSFIDEHFAGHEITQTTFGAIEYRLYRNRLDEFMGKPPTPHLYMRTEVLSYPKE